MATGSVVDYMNARKQDSSYSSRAKAAKSYGILNYKGTAQQNTQLLNKMSAATKAPVKKPVAAKPVAKAPVKPVAPVAPVRKTFTANEQKFFSDYSKQIDKGTNDPKLMAQYQEMAKRTGAKASSLGITNLQRMSVQALNGDKQAATYLKAMHSDPLTGEKLWKGVDQKTLKAGSGAYNQYRADNPYSATAQDYDIRFYDSYNKSITENKPMTAAQEKWYQETIKRWKLDDMNDPLQAQKAQTIKDQALALGAQDQALNSGMVTMDRNNFQQFQSLGQDMSNRGMDGSGISADAYTRMTMGANADYQNAYTEAAKTKAGIQAEYTEKIGAIGQAIDEKKTAAEQQKIENEQAAQEAQLKQDDHLTKSSGVVHIGGTRLMYKGQPVTTVEYQKMTETQRHNMVTEMTAAQKLQYDYELGQGKLQNDAMKNQYDYAVGSGANQNNAIKNANTYAVGMDKNQIAREKIASDIAVASSKLKFDYDKLDQNWEIETAKIANAAAKLEIAATDSSTKAESVKARELSTQLNNLNKQISDQRKAKPPIKVSAKQKAKLKELNEKMDALFAGK